MVLVVGTLLQEEAYTVADEKQWAGKHIPDRRLYNSRERESEGGSKARGVALNCLVVNRPGTRTQSAGGGERKKIIKWRE
jgi:hypothetical protein